MDSVGETGKVCNIDADAVTNKSFMKLSLLAIEWSDFEETKSNLQLLLYLLSCCMYFNGNLFTIS